MGAAETAQEINIRFLLNWFLKKFDKNYNLYIK